MNNGPLTIYPIEALTLCNEEGINVFSVTRKFLFGKGHMIVVLSQDPDDYIPPQHQAVDYSFEDTFLGRSAAFEEEGRFPSVRAIVNAPSHLTTKDLLYQQEEGYRGMDILEISLNKILERQTHFAALVEAHYAREDGGE